MSMTLIPAFLGARPRLAVEVAPESGEPKLCLQNRGGGLLDLALHPAYTHVPQHVNDDAGAGGITGRWDRDDLGRFADRPQRFGSFGWSGEVGDGHLADEQKRSSGMSPAWIWVMLRLRVSTDPARWHGAARASRP